ncbi:hypothetical protein CBF93_07025, partial [Limosilactobacillus reuteri]|uniref:hypothetical protein n=1 Tax=Limosilactobacillus reuteri TaxID=1598 RepID=UPI000BC82BE0
KVTYKSKEVYKVIKQRNGTEKKRSEKHGRVTKTRLDENEMINKIGVEENIKFLYRPILIGSLLREIKRFGKEYYLFCFERDY